MAFKSHQSRRASVWQRSQWSALHDWNRRGDVYSLNTTIALTVAYPSKTFLVGKVSSSSCLSHKSTHNYQGGWWLRLGTMWFNSWPQHRGLGCVLMRTDRLQLSDICCLPYTPLDHSSRHLFIPTWHWDATAGKGRVEMCAWGILTSSERVRPLYNALPNTKAHNLAELGDRWV